MELFYSCLSDVSDQYGSTTATYFRILLQFLITKEFIASFLKTVCDHTDGCSKHYRRAYSIYLLTFIYLPFF